MSNGPKKITELPVATSFAATDQLVIVQNVATSPITTSITPGLLFANYANTSAPSFTNNVTVANAVNIGNTSVFSNIGYNTTTGAVAAFGGNVNNFIEIALYNSNAQSQASADMIVFDNNGPLGSNWVDMGIVGTGWSNSTWTISNPSDAYLYSSNTNLSIGVQSLGGGLNYVNFFTGGALAANERMRIDAGGNVNIGNTTGTTSLIVGTSSTKTVVNSTVITTTTHVGNAASGPAYAQSLGYMGLPQNFTNTNYTLALSDFGGHILTQNTGSGTQTITLPTNAAVAFPLGATVTIVVQSTGSILVSNSGSAGVTLYLAGSATSTTSRSIASYGMATLVKIGTNTWMISGTGVT
jgi:hypothetical protein